MYIGLNLFHINFPLTLSKKLLQLIFNIFEKLVNVESYKLYFYQRLQKACLNSLDV